MSRTLRTTRRLIAGAGLAAVVIVPAVGSTTVSELAIKAPTGISMNSTPSGISMNARPSGISMNVSPTGISMNTTNGISMN